LRLSSAPLQFLIVLGAFVAGVLIGRLGGASWGVAAGVGQLTFATTLVAVLMLSPSR
jgi:hypothetical protein